MKNRILRAWEISSLKPFYKLKFLDENTSGIYYEDKALFKGDDRNVLDFIKSTWKR